MAIAPGTASRRTPKWRRTAIAPLTPVSLFGGMKVATLLINLFVIALTLWMVRHDGADTQVRAEIVSRNLAQVLENQIAGAIKTDEVALFAVIDEYQRRRGAGHPDVKALNAYIEQVISRLPEIDALRITDAAGTLIVGTGVKPGSTTNLADRPHFMRLRDDPEAGLVISQPQISRINQKWVIVLARRINQPDGSFDGMAFVAITLDHFSKSFATLDVGPNGVITLRDAGLRLVARYPRIAATHGEPGDTRTAPVFNEMIGAGQSAATVMTSSLLDGIERTYSYRRIGAYPLYVFVGLSPQDYLAEWRTTAAIQGLVAGLFVLTASVAAALMHRAWRQRYKLIGALAEGEARLRNTINSALDGIISIDAAGRLIDFNPAAETIFGWKKAEILDRVMADVLIPARHRDAHVSGLARYTRTGESRILNQRFESTAMRRDGSEFPVELAIVAVRAADGEIFTGYLRDISERKAMEEEVRQLAFYDPLTRLPNRRLLKDRLSQTRAASRRTRCFAAVVFLDLDNFKPLNDNHGHDVGDLLLLEVAKRLKHCVREMDTVARFGGDEFVLIINELTADAAESASQVRMVAEKIRARLSEPYWLTIRRVDEPDTGVEHRCTASIGVALFRGDGTSEDDLLRRADMAMYQAKATRNLFVFDDQAA